MKKLFVFDLDGTLAESKSSLGPEIAGLLGDLLSFMKVAVISGIKVEKVWGEAIENRGSQITLSVLGQQAPLSAKESWDPDFAKRKRISAILEPLLPNFSIRMGGTTSIDVTKPGIDKAYGIKKLRDHLDISLKEMLFAGDAIFEGGNDYPAQEVGVDSILVRDTRETARVIQTVIACLGDGSTQIKSPGRP